MYNQLDQVRLKTIKNVTYLSAIPGTEASPKGIWTVAANLGADLLLTKNGSVIRIPSLDVLKIADAAIMTKTVISDLRKLIHGQEGQGTPKKD